MRLTSLALTLALFTLIAPLITSCGGAAEGARDTDDRIVVEFWHAMGSGHSATLNEICALFNESQDKYNIVPIYQGRYNSLSQKLIASMYARRSPAMSQMYPSWTARFYQYGYLEPLNAFIDRDPEFTQADLDDFYPVMIEENTLINPETGEPELTGLPFNKSVFVLFINEERMRNAGWETPPTTWAELQELATAMTVRSEGGQIQTFGFASRPYIEDLTIFTLAADAQMLDEETEEILINTESTEASLRFLHSLVSGEEGGARVGYVENDYLTAPFASEIVAMYVSSTAGLPYNERAIQTRFPWTITRVPSRDGETEGRTLMQGTNVGIFRHAPEEAKEGAWEFLKFLSSPEMNAKWAAASGYMPIRYSTLDVPEFAEFLRRDRRFANAVDTLPYATYEPRLIYWESVRQVISQQVEAVLFNRRTINNVLRDAHRTVENVQQAAN
ncbi:MAG: ABC transporter substrate-binding protein [Candidatus Sumerlaeia bacterium]|nr:ABC transporter substrate-binding protein [Candidatus Sumerlaeia bacterium]